MTAPMTKKLPPGWQWTKLGNILERIEAGKSFRCAERPPRANEVGVVKVSAVTWGRFDEGQSKTCQDLSKIDERLFIKTGDFLFSRANTVSLIGACVIVDRIEKRIMLSDKILRFHSKNFNKKWMLYFLRSPLGRQQIESTASGNQESMRNISQGNIIAIQLPIAPPRVMTETIRHIELEMSRLDFAESVLKRIQANLKCYRTSVLLEALSGTTINSEKIPQGWVLCTVKDVGKVQLGRQRSPKNHNGPHMRPYLRVANVFENRIDTTDIMSMNFTPSEYETFKLQDGDILLNEGQSPELVGRPAIYRGEVPGACFQNTLVRFQANEKVLPGYALIVFRAYLHAKKFQEIARWTTNIAHLGSDRFANMPFPLPPIAAQKRIIADVDRQLSAADAVAAQVNKDLRRSRQLRQAILTLAFEGKLTTQDGADSISEHQPTAGASDPPQLSLAGKTDFASVIDPPRKPQRRSRTAMAESPRKIRTSTSGGSAHRALVDVLRESPDGLPPEDLFRQAGFSEDPDVDLFYRELAEAVGKKLIRQMRPDNETVRLIAEDA